MCFIIAIWGGKIDDESCYMSIGASHAKFNSSMDDIIYPFIEKYGRKINIYVNHDTSLTIKIEIKIQLHS